MIRKYFITATGTEIGKTYLVRNMIELARANNIKINALKPLISGYDEMNPNNDSHIIAAELGVSPREITAFFLKEPLSPDHAAKIEGVHIYLEQLKNFCINQSPPPLSNYIQLIEGAGGIMSPICSDALNIDLAHDLQLPIILVGGTYLGAISHILSAYHIIKSKGIGIRAVILNESIDSIKNIAYMIESLQNFGISEDIILLLREKDNSEVIWGLLKKL